MRELSDRAKAAVNSFRNAQRRTLQVGFDTAREIAMASSEMSDEEFSRIMDELPTDSALKFYDRTGKQITLRQHSQYYGDKEYRFIRRDDVEGLRLATVWLGDVHEDFMVDPPPDPPRIFGTLIWRPDADEAEGQPIDLKRRMDVVAEIRSAPEALALERHDKLVAAIKAGTLDAALKDMEQDRVQ